MDVSGIFQERLSAITRDIGSRVSQIASPAKLFADVLSERMGGAQEAAARYISAMPSNWTTFESPPTQAGGTTAALAAPAVETSATLRQRQAAYDPLVQQAAAKYNLPAELIHGVIRAESAYDPSAVSSVGAQGLMQLMPGTARDLGVTDAFDAAQNIDGGAKYLRQMLERFDGDVKLALAAYNCGPSRVEGLGISASADTLSYTKLSGGVRSYVNNVLGYTAAYSA